QCLEARCASAAKLYVKINEESDPFRISKIRCNSSKWMANGAAIYSAASARDCNAGTCKKFHPQAKEDFTPLVLVPATEQTTHKCATTEKCPNGFASLNYDGYPLNQLDKGVDKLTCT
ncbi:hypothetical protein PENTCL1PPCAC_10003, partial [Pristionchus entomophagus]